jgi:hypothetical protein
VRRGDDLSALELAILAALEDAGALDISMSSSAVTFRVDECEFMVTEQAGLVSVFATSGTRSVARCAFEPLMAWALITGMLRGLREGIKAQRAASSRER